MSNKSLKAMFRPAVLLVLASCLYAIAVPVLAQQSQAPTTPPTRRAFEPTRQIALSAASDQLELRLLAAQECLDCPPSSYFRHEYSVSVGNHQQGQLRTIRVVGPAQIDEMRVVDVTRGLLIGRVQASVGAVVLFDVETGAVLDKFIAMDPVASPGSRFIAYVKAFPIHFTEGVSAQYLIYDTAADPSRNRNATVAAADEVNVGISVYPQASTNVPGDNIGRTVSHQLVSSTFFWSADGRRVAFADREGGIWTSIVAVDLSNGLAGPLVSTTPLDTYSIVNTGKCQLFERREGEAFTISNIEFVDSLTLRIGFRFSPLCDGLSEQVLRLSW